MDRREFWFQGIKTSDHQEQIPHSNNWWYAGWTPWGKIMNWIGPLLWLPLDSYEGGGFPQNCFSNKWRLLWVSCDNVWFSQCPFNFPKPDESCVKSLSMMLCACVFDDSLVYSKFCRDYLQQLGTILRTLQANWLYFKKFMCAFRVQTMEYTSHIILEQGI